VVIAIEGERKRVVDSSYWWDVGVVAIAMIELCFADG